MWELGTISYAEETLALTFATEPVDLPQQTHLEALSQEYQTLGVMLHEHPLRSYRQRLTGQGVATSRDLALYPPGQRVKAAGLVVMHQAPPTAKGFHFVTLEDEYGFVNVVIRPQIYQQWRKLVRGASLLLVEGQVERDGAVTNLLASGFREL
ncbi:MAG: hypothetical protein K8L99_19025 [Anaerolineae bacterium]|nr:hypothetical protein [Anaerolineae bacterium]